MGPEELNRAIADAFTGGDRNGFLALMHQEAETYLLRSLLEGGAPYRGLEGAAQLWADSFDVWERFEIEPDEAEAVGGVLVLALRTLCIPRGEGPPVEYVGYWVTELRDGKIVYWRPYLHRAEALDAAHARANRAVMASANVELVRSVVADWARGDYSSAGWADHEIEFVLPDGPDPGSWRGVAEMAEAWRGRMSVWEKLAGHIEDCRALDDERVLVLFQWTGRGKTSGIELANAHARAASLFHVRNGRVTRFVHYWDRERAFTDLGLTSAMGGAG